MFLSLLFGILRLPWWTPAIAVATGLAINALVGPQRSAWREAAGLAGHGNPAAALAIGIGLAAVIDWTMYAAGRGARAIHDRRRGRKSGTRQDPARGVSG